MMLILSYYVTNVCINYIYTYLYSDVHIYRVISNICIYIYVSWLDIECIHDCNGLIAPTDHGPNASCWMGSSDWQWSIHTLDCSGGWTTAFITHPKISIEPENHGLVQMIFLLQGWKILRLSNIRMRGKPIEFRSLISWDFLETNDGLGHWLIDEYVWCFTMFTFLGIPSQRGHA